MCARALALWCALALGAGAVAYTIDCNHEYADCDTELSKLAEDDDPPPPPQSISATPFLPTIRPTERQETTLKPTTTPPSRTSPIPVAVENTTEVETATEEVATEAPKPKPRLLNLNVDELENFAIALHNQTHVTKDNTDLSDVTLDGEEDYESSKTGNRKHEKEISDKFFTNLQAPFHPMLEVDRSEEVKGDVCKENEISYKIGEHIDRACEETCECTPGGVFDCTPRCKHPYVRRGRRLDDPLCFESPVDECCSIIACATGNGEKITKLEVCRYGNDTYRVGTTWTVGCDQKCSCEKNSVVTCKPRCNPLPPSDKCINVQDPNDACCEVQVCDVSQDVHEEPLDNATSTTSTTEHLSKSTSDELKSTMRPLVLTEPIGSIKVLQNNSVQVNLMHANSSEDPIHLLLSNDGGKSFKEVELKYDNIILNLEKGKDYILKTKETGTKFNFTITAMDMNSKEQMEELIQVTEKIGCHHDGKFYDVGEEFHIGCTELCECTGAETRECAALECPSHVGLELVSKGCVRWAPSPPPQPPNCCPRAARCLSDGTCHYKEVAIPNWTEVPISLTGCEQRCFCENGELDCQEVCTPLAPLPPQTLRCPPLHRPAPVNISDEDCCKQWGCVPNADDSSHSHIVPMLNEMYFVTPVVPVAPGTETPPTPSTPTDSMNFYKYLKPKTIPKILKIKTKTPIFNRYMTESSEDFQTPHENITTFSSGISENNDAPTVNENQHHNSLKNDVSSANDEYVFPVKPERKNISSWMKNFQTADDFMHDLIRQPITKYNLKSNIASNSAQKPWSANPHPFDSRKMFIPTRVTNNNGPQNLISPIISSVTEQTASYSKPLIHNHSLNQPEHFAIHLPLQLNLKTDSPARQSSLSKHVTILKTKDLISKRPTDTNRWGETNTHVLTKLPNPYETVLLRTTPNVKPYEQHRNTPLTKTYSSLDLEHILSQMEVETEVSRNLGRSADKNQDAAAGTPPPPPGFGGLTPQKPQQPSFLPTISPEIHFPDEDSSDYEQNKLQRPTNPLVPGIPGLPPGLPGPPSFGEENKKLSVMTLVSDSPTSVKMLFGLPPVLVGLRGSVDLRYTDKPGDDITHWYSQVFAPADEVLTTSRLEFRLTGLKPATVYRVRGKLYLHNLPVEPESEVYSIRTLDLPTVQPVEISRREIDSRLTVLDVNDTVAHITWRRFTEEELQYIDGIQIRYRPVGTPIYSMTELLHHSRAAAALRELRAGSRYEASLVLVPPPRAAAELLDPTVVEFTTAAHVDPYDWSVTVEARSVGAEAAELTWRGVPAPAERWVRVYRAAHACGGARREHDAFRLAARDLAPSITLAGLEPDTRCRVWLELFLTNGKVKTSNVIEIHTKSLDSPEPIDNAIEASSVGGRGAPRGDYYGALVAVGVVAALGALTSLLLLLVVVRRHRPRSVPITPVPTAPRESSLPPYDNPAYKLELQQETMDL